MKPSCSGFVLSRRWITDDIGSITFDKKTFTVFSMLWCKRSIVFMQKNNAYWSLILGWYNAAQWSTFLWNWLVICWPSSCIRYVVCTQVEIKGKFCNSSVLCWDFRVHLMSAQRPDKRKSMNFSHIFQMVHGMLIHSKHATNKTNAVTWWSNCMYSYLYVCVDECMYVCM